MFNWFQELSLTNEIELVRNHFSNYNFPDWIVYNLPDLLWVFSFTSLLLIIWNMKINKENIAYIIVPMGLGIISELGQLFSIMDGTFDKIDLLFYLLGGLTSVFIFSKLKTNNNEKTITTFR